MIHRRPMEGIPAGITAHAQPVIPEPLDAPNLVAWWRGDLGITIDTGVGVWADQSGNGNDLLNTTDAQQPVYEPTGFGGKPSLLFDGTDDSLFAVAGTILTAFNGSDKPITVIGAMSDLDIASAEFCSSWGWSGVASLMAMFNFGNQSKTYIQRTDDAAAGADTSATGTIVNASPHIHSVVFPGTTISTWVDGTAKVSAAAMNVGVSTYTKFDLCSLSTFGNRRWAELAIFSRALTTAERQLIERYMGARYGITVA